MKKLSVCLLSIFILLSLSCEIGLGASVDTEAPTLEIANPPSDAIIRDSFAVSGSWKDDGSISSVTMEMVRLDNNKRVSFEGTFADPPERGADGSWQVVINPKETGLLDGTYEALVAISDNGGHTTTMARSFTIDNTPPVMLLSRPSTKVVENGSFDSYGQSFTLEGKAADDNDVSLIEVNIYETPSSTTPLKTVELKNIPLTIEQNVAVFKSNEANAYSAIYGHTDSNGIIKSDERNFTEERYCTITIYDGAERYPVDGSAQTDADKKGNSTNSYYMNSEMTTILSDYKITDLYHILNGSLTDGSGRSAAPASIKQQLSQKAISKSQFSLNPANNPSFVVTSRSAYYTSTQIDENTITLDAVDYQLTAGNSHIEVEVNPGLDKYPILPNTVGVYLLECTRYGIIKRDADGNPEKTICLFEPGEENHTSDKVTIVQSGDTYKFKTANPIGKNTYPELTGDYYYIYVVGNDSQGDDKGKIVSDGIYAFKLITTESKIELSGQGTPDYVSKLENSSGVSPAWSVSGHENFSATLTWRGGEEGLDVYRIIGYTEVKVNSSTNAPAINSEAIWHFTDTIPCSTLKAKGYPENIKYVLRNSGSVAVSTEATVRVRYDEEAPHLSISDFTNSYPKDEQTYFVKNDNGQKSKIKGIATDNTAIEKVELFIPKTASSAIAVDTRPRFEFTDVDFSSFTDRVTASVVVTDVAGNQTSEDLLVIFDITPPAGIHEIDAKGKDLYFRVGEGRGNKYSKDSYGNTNTITIRGYFDDARYYDDYSDPSDETLHSTTNASGLDKIYYKVFTDADLADNANLISNFEQNYVTQADGFFKPLESTVTCPIPKNLENGTATDVNITTNYEYTISGFDETVNYLSLVAVDKVGNAALERILVDDEVRNKYVMNNDYEAPAIIPDSQFSNTQYINNTLDHNLVITGTATDNASGVKSIIVKVNNEIISKATDADGTEKGTISFTSTDAQQKGTSGTWSLEIKPSVFENVTAGNVSVYATITDNAGTGNSQTVTIATVNVDTLNPVVANVKLKEITGSGSNAVTKEVYSTTSAGTTNYYLNNTAEGKTFTITGLATDNVGVQKVTLVVTNTADTPASALTEQTINNPESNWSFTVGDWSSWTDGATARVTVYDKAGNYATNDINIVFDVTPPQVDASKLKIPTPIQTESNLFKFEGQSDSVKHNSTEDSVLRADFDKVDIAFSSEPETGSPTPPSSAQNTANIASNGSWSSTIEFANTAFNGVFNTQGKKYLWVKAYDKAGNASDWISKEFIYDTATPTISFTTTTETTNPAADSYRNTGFTLEVEAEDSYGINKVEVKYNTEVQEADTSSTDNPVTSATYFKAFRVGEETGDAPLLADGLYSFEVVVTDNSGSADIPAKTNKITRRFTVDTHAPVISAKAVAETLVPAYTDADDLKWYNTNQIPVTATVTDNLSGITSVQASTDSSFASFTSLILKNGVWQGSIMCSEQGRNSIYFKAIDSAGNETNATEIAANLINVYIDTTAPESPVLLGVSTPATATAAATAIPASQITSVLTNKTVPLTVYAALRDTYDSNREDTHYTGISNSATGAAFIQKGKSGTSAPVAITALPQEIQDALPASVTSANPSYVIWSYEIATDDMDNGGVNFTVKDNAGNLSDYTLFQMVVDDEPPTAEINDITNLNVERADDDTTVYVNGTITLSGTASDNQKLASLLVEYKKHSDADTAANWTPITDAPANSTLASWKRTLDTTALDDETEYDIRVSATDMAGNSTASTTLAERTKTIKVSQDSDRPVITVTSPTSIEDLATGSVKWQNRTISGTVTDDDSVTYIGYYRGNDISYTDSDYTTITINNGIWRVTLPDDGTDKVFFKVTAGGKDYFANMATTFTTATIYDETNSRGTYKLTDGSHGFGYRLTGDATTENALALIIDTVAPDVETAEFSIDNGVTWNSGIGAQTFGGTRKNIFKIRQTGWDKNGVKSMTVKITETVNGTETSKFDETYDLTSNPVEEARPNGKIYYRFTSGEIDVTGWESSSKSNAASVEYRIEIVMSDGINSSSTKLDLTVDNTPPVISFTSPDSNTTHSGEISVNGSSDELGSFYYTVSTYGDAAHKPSLAAGQALTGWTGFVMSEDGTKTATSDSISNVAVPAYTLIPTTTLSWGVHFDGNTSDTQRAHANLLKNYVQSLGITNNLNEFTDLVNFYVWIKAEDAVGNTEEYSHLVCIDPQGDRPSISILTPENPGASLGGTIKLYGSAEDSNGTVESVWVQLLSEKNGGSTAGYGPVNVSNNNITNFAPTTKDLDFWKSNGFTVAKMKPEVDGTHTEWTGTTASPGSLSGSDSASDYGIKAVFTGTTSWNLKINKNQEFNSENPNNGVNKMALRVYACDNDKNLSYPVTRYFITDKGAPVISEVMLRQYAEDDTSFAHPLASQEVRSGMYVKGKWYLEFTATDDNKLNSVLFKDESNNETAIPSENISQQSDTVWKVRYALATNQGVGIFKRTIEAKDDNGNPGNFDIEINYDNEAPKLLRDSSTDFNIEAAVRQSNGFYKLYSKVNDSTASQTGTPSGVKAVGFYFMRRKAADEGLIYDPMQKRADPISTKNLTYADGLYWFSGAVSINSEGVITLGSGLSEKSAYIHTGSYIRLDGVMYKIISVSGNNVTIEESVDTNLTSAQIALAQFVDNRKAEYEASSAKNTTTGYYSSIKNDDGDSMIEELGGTNTVSSWQASIVSRNIPDGPIEIHYTAYDASLNYAVGVVGNKDKDVYETYTTPEVNEIKDKTQVTDGQYASYVYTYNSKSPAYISNNAPRLAGVTVKIDYIGTGNYETATPTTYYFNESPVLINGNAVKKPITVTDNFEIYDEAKDEDGNLIGYKGVNTIKGKTWIIPEMVGGNKKLWYSYNIYGSKTDGSKDTTVVKIAGGDDAVYFADGRDDYDEYEEKAAGQTYVVSHNTSKLGENNERTESYIVHDTSVFTTTGDTTSITSPFWFDYVIYDSTETEPESGTAAISALENNQKARISIAMAVDVNDIIAPSVVINDLYWKNAADNSVYWEDGKSKGHVELISDIGTTALGTTYGTDDDKVSGVVKFSGYAYDNKCLKELKWAIVSNPADGSYTSPAYLFGSGMQDGASFDINSGTWTSSATLENNYYKFVVSKEKADGAYHDKNGHRVKWTLIVDTSHITGVVAENVRVIVQAKDNAATTPQFSEISNDVTAESRSTYKVDVVPYITGIDTELSKSLKSSIHNAYSRTALGHYIARSTETLAVNGFNLGNSTIVPKYGESSLSFDSDGNALLPVSLLASSGQIMLTVNNLPTVNNLNNNNACGSYRTASTQITENSSYDLKSNYAYNRMPNKTSNNLLTDDVFVDIWEFDSDAAKPMSGELREPSMQINPVTGQVGLAFVSGPANISMADDNNSYTKWQQNFATYNNISFTYDALGKAHATATGLDTNPNDKHAGRFSYFYSPWGTSGITDQTGNYGGINAIRLESIAVPYVPGTATDIALDKPYLTYKNNELVYNKQIAYTIVANGNTINSATYGELTETRFYSPSLAATVHGTDDTATTAVYLAYYDSVQKQIRFRYNSEVSSEWSEDGTSSNKDDFVDNTGYFYNNITKTTYSGKTGKYQDYMEASTENFSLIAGVDTQQGEERVAGASFTKKQSVNKIDEDGNKYYIMKQYLRIKSIKDDNTLDDEKKNADLSTLTITQEIWDKLHPDLQTREDLAVGKTVNIFTRTSGTYNWIIQPDGLIYYSTDNPDRADQGQMTHVATDIDPHDYKYPNGRKLDPDVNYTVYKRVEETDGYKYAAPANDQSLYFWPDVQTESKIEIPLYSKNVCNAYDTGYTGYKYVAIDAKAGEDAAHDVVVAVWYDGTNCHYAYNDNPTSGKDNGDEVTIDGVTYGGGWKGNKIIFSEGGEHCTVKLDSEGRVHIAAYVDGSLRYAYLSSVDATYKESTDSVKVDSFTITGERITLDVGKDSSGNFIPYISYFNGTARLPCVAKLVVPAGSTPDYKAQGTGTDDGEDMFTGNWEISLVPSPKTLTTNYYDKMNICLWKQAGTIVTSKDTRFTVTGGETGKTSNDNSSGTTNGNIYGNGTANPILGYAIESTSGTCLETAQMK